VAKLPRVSAHGMVSSDLGAYKIFACSGTGADRSCGLNTAFIDELSPSGGAGTLQDYVVVR
jgi:hypothetical protein